MVSQSTPHPSLTNFTWSSSDSQLVISAADSQFSKGLFYLSIYRDCSNESNSATAVNTSDDADFSIEVFTQHVAGADCSQGLALHMVLALVLVVLVAAGLFAGLVYSMIASYRQASANYVQ